MPDGNSGIKPQITIENWRPLVKNTLRGFVNVRLPWGPVSLLVREITVHRKNDRAWCGLPAKPRINQNGTPQKDEAGKIKYTAVMEWSSKEAADRFSATVIDLIEQSHPGATQ